MKDTRKRLLDLADTLEPSVARAFMESIRDIRSEAQLALIVDAIEAGDIDGVFRILQIRPERFAALDDAFRAVFLRGAAYQIDSVPKKLNDPSSGARLIVRFGGSQPRAQQIVAEMGGRLITGLIDSERENVTAVVQRGLSEGHGTKRIALGLIGRMSRITGKREGGLIGLTDERSATVQSVKDGLASGDRERMRSYLSLKGRDKRYDGSVKRALRDGKALDRKMADRISMRLADRYLRERGENIAQSETIPALNAARREAMQQMIDRGVIRPWQVQRGWDATGDARTRLDHLRMEGQTVEWGRPFTFPDGSQAMGPGDTSLGAPARQTARCRCYEKLDVDYLAGAA